MLKAIVVAVVVVLGTFSMTGVAQTQSEGTRSGTGVASGYVVGIRKCRSKRRGCRR